MSVHIQRIRLYTRTKDERNAGTDDHVHLDWRMPNHMWSTYEKAIGGSTPTFRLDNPWDDRERGRTDMFEIDLQRGTEDIIVNGTTVPRGVAFHSWSHAKGTSISLQALGNDLWRMDHYLLFGDFEELRVAPGTTDQLQRVDHGWLLMAFHEGDVNLSKNPDEGLQFYPLNLNGPFLCEQRVLVPADLTALRNSTETVARV